jgi:hypothetical protein
MGGRSFREALKDLIVRFLVVDMIDWTEMPES